MPDVTDAQGRVALAIRDFYEGQGTLCDYGVILVALAKNSVEVQYIGTEDLDHAKVVQVLETAVRHLREEAYDVIR